MAKARALEIVTVHRVDIEKISVALLKHKRLDAQAMDNVIYWGSIHFMGIENGT
jgi:hypothetical protein